MKTWAAPKIAVCAVSSTIIRRRGGFRPSVVNPASRSAMIVDASSSRRGCSLRSTWMRSRKNVETKRRMAVIAEDEPRAGHGEQHTRERGAGEHGDALDAARHGVCGGQLFRCTREAGREGCLRGSEGA